jgi:hypothetical protein
MYTRKSCCSCWSNCGSTINWSKCVNWWFDSHEILSWLRALLFIHDKWVVLTPTVWINIDNFVSHQSLLFPLCCVQCNWLMVRKYVFITAWLRTGGANFRLQLIATCLHMEYLHLLMDLNSICHLLLACYWPNVGKNFYEKLDKQVSFR